MRSNGIASAGGVGTVIADWIVEGRPPFDMYGLDIARCLGMHNNKRFLRDRWVLRCWLFGVNLVSNL